METGLIRKRKKNGGGSARDAETGRARTWLRVGLLLSGWVAVLWWVPAGTVAIDQSTADALKVQHILKTIEAKKKNKSGKATKQAVISERELNAYIVYRLAREQDPIIKNLKVSLLNNNQVAGNIQFDLGGFDLLALLGSDLSFDFKGRLKTQEGGGRIDLTSLYLNGRSVPPQTLDAVLVAVARYYGEAPGSINDWYELPKGIDRIAVSQGKAVLFY